MGNISNKVYNKKIQTIIVLGIAIYFTLLIININYYIFMTIFPKSLLLGSLIVFSITMVIVAINLWKLGTRSYTEKSKIQKQTDNITDSLNIVKLTSENRIIYTNNNFCKLTGYNIEEMIGESFLKLFNIKYFHISNTNNLEHSSIKLSILSKDNKKLSIMFNTFVLKDSTTLAYIVDLTRFQKLEVSLRTSLIEYNALFNNSSVGFVLLNNNNIINRVNTKTIELLGYKAEELIGSNIDTLIEDNTDIINILTNNNKKDITVPIRTKLNKLIWLMISINHIKLEYIDNGLILSLQDVTKHVEVEKELKSNQIKLDFIIRKRELAIWKWDLQTNKIEVSQLWYERLGYKKHEIYSFQQLWNSLLHKDEKEEAFRKIQDHIKGVTDIFTAEHRYLNKNGKYHWMRETARVFDRDENGTPLIVMGIQDDITEAKELDLLKNLTLSISGKFINSNKINIEDIINNSLKELINILDCDNSFIYKLDKEEESFNLIYQYKKFDIYKISSENYNIRIDENIWAAEKILNNKSIVVERENIFLNETINKNNKISKSKTKSIIIVPIIIETKPIAFIGVSAKRNERKWSGSIQQNIQIIGNQTLRTLENVNTNIELDRISKELIENNKELDKLHKIANLGEWSFDLQTNRFQLSPIFYQKAGLPQKLYSTMDDLKLISDDTYFRKNYKDFINFAKKGGSGSIIHKIITLENKIKYFRIFFQNVDINDPYKLNGIAIDITEKEEINQALERSKRQYLEIFEKTGHSMCLVSKDRVIHKINNKLAELIGYKKEEVEGKMEWTNFVAKKDRESMLNLNTTRNKNAKNTVSKYVFNFLDKNGNSLKVFCSVSKCDIEDQYIVTFVNIDCIKDE